MQNIKTDKQDQGLNILDLLSYLLSKWVWYILCIGICCTLAYYYYAKTPLTYFRSATIIIKDPSNKSVAAGLDRFDNYINKVNVANELLQFKSKNLMRTVVSRLDADVDYKIKTKLRYRELYTDAPVKVNFKDVMPERDISFDLTVNNKYSVTLSNVEGIHKATNSYKLVIGKTYNFYGEKICVTPTEDMSEEFFGRTIHVHKLPLTAAANNFRANLGIRQEEDEASIITLSLKDNSGYRAEDVLNMLITVYNEDAINDKNQISINTAKFIDERLKIIAKELGGVEDELLAYKINNNIINLAASTSQYMGKSNTYSDAAVEQEVQLKVAQYVKNYLADPTKSGDLIPANSGIEDNEIEGQIGQYNALKLRRDRLIKESSEENPVVEEIDKAMHNLRQSVIRAVDNKIVSIDVKRKDAIFQHNQAQSRLNSMPVKERGMLSIERQQQIKEQLYLFLLNKREENALSQAMADNNARVIDPAEGSFNPIAPERNKILLFGFLIGFALPTAYFLFIMFMDTRVRSRKDLKGVLSVPFLAEIPYDKELDKERKNGNFMPIISMDEGMLSEAFRILRSNMMYMGKKEKLQVITFTSFNEGAGKSFISRNLAGVLAYSKKRVIMVDIDIRKRTLSHLFNGHKQVGLTNYFVDDSITVDEIIHHDEGGENIDIIYAGHSAPNPAELLMDNRLDQLMDELRKRYDYIIADSVPVGIVADATISNRVGDVTLFVVRAGKLDRRQLPDIEGLYAEGKLKNMAVVLNGVDPKYRGYGYRYGYGYGYGYGYRYGYGYGEHGHHHHKRSLKHRIKKLFKRH